VASWKRPKRIEPRASHAGALFLSITIRHNRNNGKKGGGRSGHSLSILPPKVRQWGRQTYPSAPSPACGGRWVHVRKLPATRRANHTTKKSPPGFMTASPLKSGWKENTTGKPAAHPSYDKTRRRSDQIHRFFPGRGQSGGPPKKPHESHRLAVARARFRPRGALDRRGGG